jgi:hypothetical protein
MKKIVVKSCKRFKTFKVSATVPITRNFQMAVKPLLKKYTSFRGDLLKLEKELIENQKQS